MEVDATASKFVAELLKVEAECEQLMREVETYNWDSGPYPLGLALPYPSEDIDFFHERAIDAHHLKTRILTVLERLAPSANQWSHQIASTNFCEVYIDDPLAKGAKRPSLSGLTAAREILRTVRVKSTPISREANPRSLGTQEAIDACRRYMDAKGLSIPQFAAACDTTDKTIRTFFKNGKVRTSIFQAIAKKMGVSTEQLLRGD